MHAVAGLDIAVGQPLGHALVSEQHSLLDQRRGTRALARHNLHGHTVLVQQGANLGRIEVDRTARATNVAAKLGEFVGGDEKITQIDVIAAGGFLTRKSTIERLLTRSLYSRNILGGTLQHPILYRAGTHQQRLGAIVVHAHARANHAGIGIVVANVALRIEFNIDGKRQTVLVGTKRAQVVRQALGQHRQHAIGQIHRCCAMARLKIDMPVPGHVV